MGTIEKYDSADIERHHEPLIVNRQAARLAGERNRTMPVRYQHRVSRYVHNEPYVTDLSLVIHLIETIWRRIVVGITGASCKKPSVSRQLASSSIRNRWTSVHATIGTYVAQSPQTLEAI